VAWLIPDNLRSREDVPAAIRRVATAFKIALDDDVIVWFEPLFDAAEERPHFIVLLPDHGLATIEVLDVGPSQVLGTLRGQIRLVMGGKEVEREQPLARAERLAQTLRTRIAEDKRLDDLVLPAAPGAVFPTLDRALAERKGLHRVPGLDLARCLFREDIESAVGGTAGNALYRWFARLLGAATPLGETEVDIVRGLVQPDIVIDSDSEQLSIFRPPEGKDVVAVMDKRQESLAKTMGAGHRVVRGVAGSGKTLILAYRAKLFAEIYPQQKFLLTCYTRTLASELRELLSGYDNVEVENLDRLMTSAIGAVEDLSAPGYEADRTGEEQAGVALEALRRGALTRYRAVFLDEAQDFGTNALRFAVSLADDRFNDVLVVADAAQNVFRRDFSWKQAGIQAQGRTHVLRRNYRNTREILDFAHALLVPVGSTEETTLDLEDENVIVPPEAAMRSGPVPSVLFTAQVSERAAEEAATLIHRRSAAKELAILYMGRKQGLELARCLKSKGVEFFFVTDPDHKENRDKTASAHEPVLLSTVHSAKGLEFPSVVLCCTPRGTEEVEALRSAMYVGMTRATERLVVLAEEDHPLRADLEAAAGSHARLEVVAPGD
jgi:hypothetical protein